MNRAVRRRDGSQRDVRPHWQCQRPVSRAWSPTIENLFLLWITTLGIFQCGWPHQKTPFLQARSSHLQCIGTCQVCFTSCSQTEQVVQCCLMQCRVHQQSLPINLSTKLRYRHLKSSSSRSQVGRSDDRDHLFRGKCYMGPHKSAFLLRAQWWMTDDRCSNPPHAPISPPITTNPIEPPQHAF